MATNKSIKSAVICVLILGLVLEQVHAKVRTCCKNTNGRNCYNICRINGGSRPVCAGTCGCKTISVHQCPRDYPTPESGEPDAIEYCAIGCRTSVCDNMDNVFHGQEIKINMGLCSNACVRFCNDGAVIQPVEA